MKKTFKDIYKDMNFDSFVENQRGNYTYGAAMLLWLDIVTDLCGFHSCREKEYFLKGLKKHNKYQSFLSLVGIDKKLTRTPSKARFSDYKKKINYDKFNAFVCMKLADMLINAKKNSIEEFKEFCHVAVDGKAINNTHTLTTKSNPAPLMTVNFMANKKILKTSVTSHESTYIKEDLVSDIKSIKKNIKKK